MDKARAAQRQGAGLLVVADDVDRPGTVSMAGDGFTGDISIPCVFVGYLDGRAMANMLSKGGEIVVALNFTIFQRERPEIGLGFWRRSLTRRNWICPTRRA